MKQNNCVYLLTSIPAAGFKALFLTLDVPYLGRRLNEYRNKFAVPDGMEYPNLFPGVDVTNLEDGDESMAYDSSIEWPQIMPFFRQHTKMEIWGKGSMYPIPFKVLVKKVQFTNIVRYQSTPLETPSSLLSMASTES